MKIFEGVLSRLIDTFKAKNPRIYAIVVFVLLTIHAFAIAAVMTSTHIVEEMPFLLETLPFIGDVPLWLGSVIYFTSGALLTLTGSSTPPGLGNGQMIQMTKTDVFREVEYTKGKHYYLKNKAVEHFISRGSAKLVVSGQ